MEVEVKVEMIIIMKVKMIIIMKVMDKNKNKMELSGGEGGKGWEDIKRIRREGKGYDSVPQDGPQ